MNHTAMTLQQYKVRNGEAPLVMVTAYDTPTAKIFGNADVDLILVGDSVAMVVLGYEDTLQVTTADIAHHVGAVSRAKSGCFIIGDLPWMSYHVSREETVQNAAMLIRAGAHAVKLEGGEKRIPMIEAIIDAEIPVMGHLGLTPQSVHMMGGYKVQAKSEEAGNQLLRDARLLQEAGCFALVLEGIPAPLAAKVTEELEIPTIGIGAGIACDGQVLVFHDLIGMTDTKVPKFVRAYGKIHETIQTAVENFRDDVREKRFPSESESYGI